MQKGKMVDHHYVSLTHFENFSLYELKEMLEQTGLSKNKLSHRAEMQRTQINHYCNNTITRLDTDVLARLCTALDCSIGELLEFVPPEKE